jgi:origin recognition complex subunit 4
MPTPSSSTPKRKRSRAQIVEDDELDELSPQKTTNSTPISTTTKRRKLTTYTSSTKTLLGSLGSLSQKLAGGLFGSAQEGKDNRQGNHHADELAVDKDLWNVVSTDDGGKEAGRSPIKEKGSAKKIGQARLRVERATPQRKSLTDQLRIDMVGHGSDEDGTPSSTLRSGRKKAEESGSTSNLVSPIINGEQITKRRPGRPSKATLFKNAKAQAREDKRMELNAADHASDEQATSTEKVRTRRTRLAMEESLPPSDSEQVVPSSINIKAKRELDRLGIDMLDSPTSTQKGILTPSKKNRTVRPQKSVTFRKSDEDMNLGFRDLPISANGKRVGVKAPKALDSTQKYARQVKAYSPVEASEEEDDEDGHIRVTDEQDEEGEELEEPKDRSQMEETACSICSKLHSPRGNQILLCDGCDLAVHQKCYSVTVIPEGDWYCRNCMTQPDRIMESRVNELPDIEGFEGHLRRVQRVVLDRLTGQSRIKISGYDDQLQKVHQVVEQTVLAGEGNSMLVIGGRGSGKTTVC